MMVLNKNNFLYIVIYLVVSVFVTLCTYEYYWQASIKRPTGFDVESPYANQIAELMNSLYYESQQDQVNYSRISDIEIELNGLEEKNTIFFAEHEDYVSKNYRAEDYLPTHEEVHKQHGIKVLLVWLIITGLFISVILYIRKKVTNKEG